MEVETEVWHGVAGRGGTESGTEPTVAIYHSVITWSRWLRKWLEGRRLSQRAKRTKRRKEGEILMRCVRVKLAKMFQKYFIELMLTDVNN